MVKGRESGGGFREIFWSVVVFAFALLLRLLYLNQIDENPLFHIPIIDSYAFMQTAQKISTGDLLAGEEIFWKPPLYPYFLAAAIKTVGLNLYRLRLIQLLMGTVSCLFIYVIGKRLFDRKIGLTSALMASCYGPLIYFEGELLPPFLVIILILFLFIVLLSWQRNPRITKGFLAGIFLGLSAITRPNILIFVPFVPIWFWLVLGKKLAKRKFLCHITLFLAGVALIILPVTLRNYALEKDWTLISWNGGINFYIGNNPGYDQYCGMAISSSIWDRVAHTPLALGLNRKSEIDSYFYHRALRDIGEGPFRYFKILAQKFYIFWDGQEISNNQDIYYFRRYSPLLKALVWKAGIGFPFGVLAPLALIGIVLSFKNWRKFLILYLFIFSYTFSVILFFNTARYRMPVIPFLILFAAYPIWWGVEKLRLKQIKPFLFVLAGTGLLFILLNQGLSRATILPSHEQIHVGEYLEGEGKFQQALFAYQEVVESRPYDIEGYKYLGELSLRMGKLTEAEHLFQRILEHEDADPDWRTLAHDRLGMTYFMREDFPKAIAEYEKIIALNPDRATYRGRPYFQLGPPDFSISAARNNLGKVYQQMGKLDQAIREYRRALTINPRFSESFSNLGSAYYQKGELDSAVAMYGEAIKADSTNAKPYNNLGALYLHYGQAELAIPFFRKAVVLDSTFIEARYNLGMAYIRIGIYPRAESEFHIILRIEPHHNPTIKALAMIRKTTVGH